MRLAVAIQVVAQDSGVRIKSVCRNREVDGDLGLSLDRFFALIVRLEMPLLHGFPCGPG